MTVTADFKATLTVNQSGANAFSGGPHWSAMLTIAQAFTDGTTAGKADIAYVAERSVNTASNDDIDLAGVLTDALGSTITAAELVMLIIWNKQKDGTANTTDLTIGNGSNPVVGFLGGTTPTIGPIKPGGFLILGAADAAGIGAVTAGTGDILRVANGSGATNKYQIAVLARSA